MDRKTSTKSTKEEGRVLLADSEVRIDLLRGKARLGGGSKGKGMKKEIVEHITGGVLDILISLKIWNCEHPPVCPYSSLVNLK